MKLNKTKRKYIIVLFAITAFLALSNFLKEFKNSKFEKMTVVLTAKVEKDDVFQFFYQEKAEPKFKIEKSVRAKIKGDSSYQDIVFDLPKIEDLQRLRLDIGENFDQDVISVKAIRFQREGDDIEFDVDEFNQLFSPNIYVISKDGKNFGGRAGKNVSKAIYDPYFTSVDNSREMELVRNNRLTRFPYLISAFICLVVFSFVVRNVERVSVAPEVIFVFIFMGILVVPSIQERFRFMEVLENLEKRDMAEKPSFSFSKKFARDYEAYYNDNFGLRNNLVNWGGLYRTKVLRSSMHPEIAKFGGDKWLFYNKLGGRMFRSYSRSTLLEKDRLKLLANKWEGYKKNYEAHGRKHFMAFWPNKHGIYPEYLPWTMKVQIRDTMSRVDQIIHYLKSSGSPVKLLDVRPKLTQEKGAKLLYHKFDSHWNDYGAFLAYQEFFNVNKNELGIEPKAESDFNISWEDYAKGELIQMLGVHNNGFFVEQSPTFTLKENEHQIEYLSTKGFPRLTVITKNEHSGNKLRALIFRDSFTNSLIQFFSLHFYEVFYIWGHQESFVEKLQPNIVIDGFVEREIGEHIQ